ncbi:MAG: DUF429 domain-containing protein [Proteobacteria bacterium]|nr:DUF429 domain-containing protein [Pseudomonadota bacterium]
MRAGPRLEPLPIPQPWRRRIPAGPGNSAVSEAHPFRRHARAVARAIEDLSRALGWSIGRIAIDAPAAAPRSAPRAAERAVRAAGLGVFHTPAAQQWPAIRARCVRHLAGGGAAARLPYANRIWMLFGFELYRALRGRLDAELIEVYPQAIVRGLAGPVAHKSTDAGYRAQLAAAAAATGWEAPRDLEAALRATVAGTRHDRLDAYLAAWVASLPARSRRAYGEAHSADDAIWVPRAADLRLAARTPRRT